MISFIGSINANSFEVNEFLDQPLRQVNPVFDKTILLFQTVLESVSIGVQLKPGKV